MKEIKKKTFYFILSYQYYGREKKRGRANLIMVFESIEVQTGTCKRKRAGGGGGGGGEG